MCHKWLKSQTSQLHHYSMQILSIEEGQAFALGVAGYTVVITNRVL
jgi:hypothetical protein